ncbi:zinc metalloproteinase nas-13-like isoform X1 [Dendronephthya gigantea]|uniref:zinc metalloproteinase nas-13-like isoform X1 n=2 Tax=Dendronephthya gigantea TaxID=151771 RepID=UPI00106DB81D|nr:zinc metalloproteinase nas-13-like isoform X1 [Dendronephthya gigantea]
MYIFCLLIFRTRQGFPMRSITLFLVLLLCLSIKGRTIKTVLAKKDERLDNNFQDDEMGSDMNESISDEKDEMMEDEDDMTKPEENLGMHYFQGDVLTTNDQMAKLTKMLDSSTADDQPHSRALVKNVRRTWRKKVVPYVIAKGVDKFRRGIIAAAIKHWQKKTCLKFKERDGEKDYIKFKQKPGCSSYVGRIGGEQELIVGEKGHACRVGNIIHEIGHAMGFFHEQSRPDRDEFVKINWKNVKPGYKVNFMKFSKRIIDSRDVVYDFGSVMHYPKLIFGKNQKTPTVIPKKRAKIGQRKGLSVLDILQIGKLYGCPVKSGEKKDEDEMENSSDTNIDNEMNTIP